MNFLEVSIKLPIDNRVILSTIPIITFSQKTGHITGFASSAIIEYNNQYFFISVAHCYNEKDYIGLNLCTYQGLPNILYFKPLYLNGFRLKKRAKIFNFLNKFLKIKVSKMSSLFTEDEPYDLIYAKILCTINPLHNVISSNLLNQPKRKLKINFPMTPVKGKFYQFYGLAFDRFLTGRILMKDICISDLKLIKEESKYYVFKTINKQKINGCSGAPILDSNGNLISMVAKKKRNKIWGTNLNTLKVVFDINYGGII